jgi:predicted GIY-YIG superfamily endonuclease
MADNRRDVKPRAWFVYLLECEGGRLYTGVSPDVAARFAAHCRGRGGAFTRGFPPRRILAARRCGPRGEAQSAEAALKRLARPAKLAWARRWRWKEGS